MKDGVYTVELDIGGRSVVATADVKDGVFRGRGCISHLTGVFRSPATGLAPPSPEFAPSQDIERVSSAQALRAAIEEAYASIGSNRRSDEPDVDR